MRILLGLLVLIAGAVPAAGQCCGDCGGDGQVTINDLVTAVNNALEGCTTGTPTQVPTATRQPTATRTPTNRCPFTFNTRGNALCFFRGRFNNGCGGELNSTFSSDGTNLIVTLETGVATPPQVSFLARITGATTASLSAWSSDGFQTSRPTAGSVELGTDATRLVVFPNDPPFQILGCNFVRYNGSYTGRGRSAVATDAEAEDLFARLRARAATPPPELVAAE